MKIRYYGLYVIFILISVCLGGCTDDKVQETNQALVNETATVFPEMVSDGETPDESGKEAVITEIKIDGASYDWQDRAVLLEDPTGDSEAGLLDLTRGYAFVNQHALYMMAEVVDPDNPFVQLDFEIQADDRKFLISWAPGQPSGNVGDITGDYQNIGMTQYSMFKMEHVLEVRVDLRDIGSPEAVNINRINIMTGECCEFPAWRAADEWLPPETPKVNEIDSPRMISEETIYQIARQFDLLSGYVGELLYAPPISNSFALASSESGIIYHQHNSPSAGISVVDPGSGDVRRILELESSISPIVNGPGDTIFVHIKSEIWQLSPDGSHSIWGYSNHASPRYYDANERLIGISNDGARILQLFPDGTSTRLADGFTNVYDVVADNDDRLFVTDWETGDLTRVDPDGQRNVLQSRILYRDPLDLGLDMQGALYLNSVTTGFVRVDKESGAFIERFTELSNNCTNHPANFVFVSSNRVLFQDPGESKLVWQDLKTREFGVLVGSGGANSRAADIGPDNRLYFGERGCIGSDPGKIYRLDYNGDNEILIEGEELNYIDDLAMDDMGGIYFVSGRVLYYVKPDFSAPRQISGFNQASSVDVNPLDGHVWVLIDDQPILGEYSKGNLIAEYPFKTPEPAFHYTIAFDQSGNIYVGGSEIENMDSGPYVDRWVLKIDPAAGTSDVITGVGREGCCCGVNLNTGRDGRLLLMGFPDFKIWEVSPEGERITFAQNLPIDSFSAVSDENGDVYFTSPGGIYHIFTME